MGFFDSKFASYAILGEAFVQAMFGNTTIKGGRFELDTPPAMFGNTTIKGGRFELDTPPRRYR